MKRIGKIIGDYEPKDEINDAPTSTTDFYIGRYPVTAAQFRAFVEATGFDIRDAQALYDPDSRPVCTVAWHEALAYCQLLHQMLTTAPAFGYPYDPNDEQRERLDAGENPTERQKASMRSSDFLSFQS